MADITFSYDIPMSIRAGLLKVPVLSAITFENAHECNQSAPVTGFL